MIAYIGSANLTGAHCKTCRRKDFCQDRIRGIADS